MFVCVYPSVVNVNTLRFPKEHSSQSAISETISFHLKINSKSNTVRPHSCIYQVCSIDEYILQFMDETVVKSHLDCNEFELHWGFSSTRRSAVSYADYNLIRLKGRKKNHFDVNILSHGLYLIWAAITYKNYIL